MDNLIEFTEGGYIFSFPEEVLAENFVFYLQQSHQVVRIGKRVEVTGLPESDHILLLVFSTMIGTWETAMNFVFKGEIH